MFSGKFFQVIRASHGWDSYEVKLFQEIKVFNKKRL